MELLDAGDYVSDVFEGVESVVGDLDAEGLLDLEGDVDLVEGVDVELFEGAGQRDGVRWDVFGFGDDFDAAAGDFGHDGWASLHSTYSGGSGDVKQGVGLGVGGVLARWRRVSPLRCGKSKSNDNSKSKDRETISG